MQLNIPAIAAIAAGGFLLSNRIRKTQLPHIEFAAGDSGPALSVEETLVVRPRAAILTALALGAGAYFAWKKYGGTPSDSSVEESIELDVPVSTAYNQWTQFEEFPKFMATVEEVKQLGDTHLHWRANVAGKTKEWDVEITEQTPDQRIAWRSTSGVKNAGVVTFHKLSPERTKVMLQMDYEPEGLGEEIVDAVGGVKLTAKGNLKRFKELVEQRGVETGAWRGTVEQR